MSDDDEKMIIEQIDVAIIGAGTAGLSAQAEVSKVTESYRVFDPGPLGTTCARNGCMPSKAFLQSAHDYHRRKVFDALGLEGSREIQAISTAVLARTRALRDELAGAVVGGMEGWSDTHLVQQAPVFMTDGSLRAGDRRFRPDATVIATGTRPVVPQEWRNTLGDRLVTTDEFFEMSELPPCVAVIGLGPVGMELGQALARLGVEVTGFDPAPMQGGISDPALQDCLETSIGREMKIVQASAVPRLNSDGSVSLSWEDGQITVDRVLVAMGRTPNIESLKLDRIGITLSNDGYPLFPPDQLNAPGTSCYFAGDVSGGPALLHEAADEGRVAGFHAARAKDAVFSRRVPLRIVFTEPQIASVGATFDSLHDKIDDIAIGSASFSSAGRARLARATGGVVRIYADKATARLRGAAVMGPEAEHIGHLLSFALCRGEHLNNLLSMPFYHPTHEEVLRRAIRATLAECHVEREALDDSRCRDTPVDTPDNGNTRSTSKG